MISAKLLAALRWLAGCEDAAHKPSTVDDLEPYCTEKVLQARIVTPLAAGDHRAIQKIGARYGAEL